MIERKDLHAAIRKSLRKSKKTEIRFRVKDESYRELVSISEKVGVNRSQVAKFILEQALKSEEILAKLSEVTGE